MAEITRRVSGWASRLPPFLASGLSRQTPNIQLSTPNAQLTWTLNVERWSFLKTAAGPKKVGQLDASYRPAAGSAMVGRALRLPRREPKRYPQFHGSRIPLVIAGVRIFRFEAELGRKFRVASVKVWNFRRQHRVVALTPRWHWKENNVQKSGDVTGARAA